MTELGIWTSDDHQRQVFAVLRRHHEFVHGQVYRLAFGAVEGELWFQRGPEGVAGVNGCTTEQVLIALINRVEVMNHQLPCKENDQAIGHLIQALGALNRRSEDRRKRGVEGTDQT